MNYFPFHIGDYSAHTAHLELMEDLAYRRMLDVYYLREEPLACDPEDVARLIRMKANVADVEAVLREFFFLTDEGWRHERCDEEIERMQDKQAKAKASAAASVSARKTKAQNNLNERSANVEPTLNERSANVELPTPTPTPTPEENPPNPPGGMAGDVHDDGFDAFWSAYPRKAAKSAAAKSWAKLKASPDLQDAVMAGLDRAKASRQWAKDGGAFIPHASTWLNQRRWEDEPDSADGGGSDQSMQEFLREQKEMLASLGLQP